MIFAACLVQTDRTTSAGGWISLQGMVSALITAPVSFPLEFCGQKLDYKSNVQMGAAILVCGVIVFAVAMGAFSLVQYLWISLRSAPSTTSNP